ncbi:MAG: tetratricopeptide repeat protein [Pseudomonadales bacterium]|nr:tetratricopeptide repeat protein [Pseudomonadales bacterium]
MKASFFVSTLLSITLILTPMAAIFVPLPAHAATDQAEEKPKRRVKRSATMRPIIYKKLEQVRELADAQQYAEAVAKLQAIDKLKRNSYEQAQTFNLYAYVAFQQEQYANAAKSYEKILALKNVPDSLLQTTLYSLTKLYLVEEKYTSSLSRLNQWFDLVENPGAEAYILRAQIYYQLEQYSKALPEVKKAVKIVEAKGQKPRENWLLIERAVYYQNKDYRGLERSLKDLIAYYPKPQYWVQLSAVYNELGKPAKELSVLESAYEQGLLNKQSELISLAQAFLAQEIPYKSAQVLIKGMQAGQIDESAKNLSLLGDALMIAKEYSAAIDVMQKAAKASNKAKDFFKLAQIHTERQAWKQALAAVDKALSLHSADNLLNDEANAYVLKGLVLFNMKRFEPSKQAFSVAEKFDSTEKTAKQWLAFVESEQKRLAYMAQI